VKVEALRQFDDRQVASDCGDRHFCSESRRVVPA
jgi:hypothetical protein